VSARNASRATTALDGNSPRECEQLGWRLDGLATAKYHGRQACLPDTAMVDAFLRALMKLAARAPDPSTKIVIPTGNVDAGELVRVVCALKRCA
jgi:hypothetical protein